MGRLFDSLSCLTAEHAETAEKNWSEVVRNTALYTVQLSSLCFASIGLG